MHSRLKNYLPLSYLHKFGGHTYIKETCRPPLRLPAGFGNDIMPSPAEVRQVVEDVCGTKGDDTVFEYVVSILEDGEFEFGPDGEDAFEAFGAVLVCVT